MTKFALSLIALLAFAPAGQAQVSVRINLDLPVAPPLVMIQPGVQVVEGFREEVFFHGGWYWCRRPGGWYRARSPRAPFVWVESRHVPGPLVRVPEGHYRNWHRTDMRHDGHRGAYVVEHRGPEHRGPEHHGPEHHGPPVEHRGPVPEHREAPKAQPQHHEAPKAQPQHHEAPKAQPQHHEAPKAQPQHKEAPKQAPPRKEEREHGHQ